MSNISRRELAFQLSIYAKIIIAFIGDDNLTGQLSPHCAEAVHTLLRCFDLAITQILTHSEGVIKTVFKAVTNHSLITRIGIVRRIIRKAHRQTGTIR